MKSFKFLVVVCLVLSTTIVSATTDPVPVDKRGKKEIMKLEIQELLEAPNFIIEETMSVTVKFTVNRNNEIVVLSVATKNNNYILESFIKSRLNYKKLSRKVKTEVYTLPVKILRSV